MGHNRRQAPINSLLARCRGALMVDTSQERHVVTQGMGQAIKPQYHTHSQGSCPPLYFSLFLRWAGQDDDLGYSPERKSAVLRRMLPPTNIALRCLSQEEGISEATLYKWRAEARCKGQLLPDADAGPEGWSSGDKFAAVLETAALNEADLAEYCRKRGLYLAQVAAWRSACEQANDGDHASTARLGQASKEEKSGSRIWNVSLPAKTAHWPKLQHFWFSKKRLTRSGGGDEDA